jgi:hypothetical protein
MRFRRLRSLICQNLHSSLASLCRSLLGLFPCPALTYPSDRPLVRVRSRFILPCRRSSSEYLLAKHPLRAFPLEALTYPGSRSSSRHHQAASTHRGKCQSPLRSAPRLSQPLDGLLRSLAVRVYFTPKPRPGFDRSGASLSVQPHNLIGRTLPPCRCSSARFASEDAPTRVGPRLRGLAPHEAAFPGIGVTRTQDRSPLRVAPSPGTPLGPYAPVTRCNFAHALRFFGLRLPARL